MITIIDTRIGTRITIDHLPYIPHKGDLFSYICYDIIIKGFIHSVEYEIIAGKHTNYEYITIKVY